MHELDRINAANVDSGRAVLCAGVDEAGRGPLAGPVVAAAVILDPSRPIEGLADSKRLSASRRAQLARRIRSDALACAVALASPREIDELNVLQASLIAMQRAVAALPIAPLEVQVDGPYLPAGFADCYRAEAVTGGDRSVAAISAASILAKVYRDRLMRWWHRRHPQYGFDRHKGYPSAQHLAALARHGPCAIHRLSYAPVAAAAKARR
jgi:ribonuclease HII